LRSELVFQSAGFSPAFLNAFLTNFINKFIERKKIGKFVARVARFVFTQYTKRRENIPNYHNITKWPKYITNGCKIFQMTVKYTSIFHSKALKNLPKLGFFGLKTNRLATLFLAEKIG
jgi:hypothetical protein